MIDAVAFQARARTIDHLGREQIADCPTAISELWKNSYDAYARNVALHIYDGVVPVAALVDDGHGMSRDDFLEKWLVIGTESKASGTIVSEDDRCGLPWRVRQGQKGIGRLSSAALGPLLLVVSKRRAGDFVAALVDWRLFENPFLYLHDIEIPVVEFASREALPALIAEMADRLVGNIWGDGLRPERDARVADSWSRFDLLNDEQGRSSVRKEIEKAVVEVPFDERHFLHWPVWNEASESGTALFVSDISFDLEAQIPHRLDSSEAQSVKQARDRLFKTLSNFTDPFYASADVEVVEPVQFSYAVTAWQGALSSTIVSSQRSFGLDQLADLEHIVEGAVDASGIFRGRVKAFGKWLDGEVVLTPPFAVPTRADSKVGPFHFRLGTFEQKAANSTHPAAVLAALEQQADLYAGFMVYRNGLRVMPYGREDNDFFEIEKRRSYHAGREFWSIRRAFGRVALSVESNPNLKDKAGREGMIDNKAAKVFRDLVVNILIMTARRFFGTDSAIRKLTLPDIQAAHEQAKAEAARLKVRARKRREFRRNLLAYAQPLQTLWAELDDLATQAKEQDLPSDEQSLIELRALLVGLRQKHSEMAVGVAPAKLGALEQTYAAYKQQYASSKVLLTQLQDSLSTALTTIRTQSKRELATTEISRNAAQIVARLRKWSSEAREILSGEIARVGDFVEQRNKSYHAEALPWLEDLEHDRVDISTLLARLEDERERQDRFNSDFFESYISTLRSLEESVDLDSLVSVTLAESDRLRSDLERINTLAQLGITVEIVGHELEGLDGTIVESLARMPEVVKNTNAFRVLSGAQAELSGRLRFLSPLKLSGERKSEWVVGSAIADYVRTFLRSQVESSNVTLLSSATFESTRIWEQPSRLLPVFVNLVNNALYWVAQLPGPRLIQLDVVAGEIVVADNGPGVDADDISNLFSLFFTRRTRGGRGVGLYLCRANLAAGGSGIRYITAPEEKVLPGANFAIKFKEIEHG